MNHISTMFASRGGRVYRSHSWELREHGNRRVALLVGNGVWPQHKEKRLISFLLDRGFFVLSLDLAFGSSIAPRVRLGAFRDTMASYAKEAKPVGLPLYLVASSFSASALLPRAADMEEVAALALVSPIVEFPPPRLKPALFFLPTAKLAVRPELQSGCPELLEGLADGVSALKFNKRDLKVLAADISDTLSKPLGLPVAVFAGEDDPFLSQAGIQALSRAGARVYGYPHVGREPGRDRLADAFYADFGSFLDEVEAGKTQGHKIAR
ncbi:MAG: hypothetical protein ABSF43_06995 [Rectinemataceae bacterium]